MRDPGPYFWLAAAIAPTKLLVVDASLASEPKERSVKNVVSLSGRAAWMTKRWLPDLRRHFLDGSKTVSRNWSNANASSITVTVPSSPTNLTVSVSTSRTSTAVVSPSVENSRSSTTTPRPYFSRPGQTRIPVDNTSLTSERCFTESRPSPFARTTTFGFKLASGISDPTSSSSVRATARFT